MLARKNSLGFRISREDSNAVEQLLSRFGITHLAERFIGELLGGQQQIVSICQAMARSPKVFLPDEPTSALDLRRQLEVMTLIKEITHERNVATIVALHDLNLTAKFADHVLLMRDGMMVASGHTEEILQSVQLAETYGVGIEMSRLVSGELVLAAHLPD